MSEARKRLYLAYGSNLNLEQMKHRCPTAKVVGATVMRNWQLLFWGVATIERCKGAQVPVLVWDIQPQDEYALDRYEGWPHLYRKESVRVTLNGKQVRAMVYVMNRGHEHAPSRAYYDTILQGYKSAGFDTNILRRAANNATKKRRITMTEKIKEQIMAVRATGKANMLDTNAVQRVAYEMELYELVCFIEDDRRAYARFVMTGKTGEGGDES
jgi:gamma-glutamylcyclotransferase (GGCT)/AIG2-like uncharacterized protein YtfP